MQTYLVLGALFLSVLGLTLVILSPSNLGEKLNNLVMSRNGGKMPVKISPNWATKCCGAYALSIMQSQRLTFMNNQTKLWLLADIIPIGQRNNPEKILSIGDLLITHGNLTVIWILSLSLLILTASFFYK